MEVHKESAFIKYSLGRMTLTVDPSTSDFIISGINNYDGMSLGDALGLQTLLAEYISDWSKKD